MDGQPAPTPQPVGDLLRSCVLDTNQIRLSPADIRAAAHDASHILLYPRAVVVARNADEVAQLLVTTARAGVGITFRSGGTSLSGQAGTDQVLVDVRRNFTKIEVLDDGAAVRVEPGVTVDHVNAVLAPYGTKLGPDPASSRACTIGGVVANNSSGMVCGTSENTYKTLRSLVAVLPSGTIIDTGQPDADDRLRLLEPSLYEGLAKLRDRVRANPQSVDTVRQQFAMKNTMGYGINSFLDFDKPIDIFAHLLIGSEGTLAFIAQATFNTVPLRAYTGTALLVFNNLFDANSALPELVASGASALELMDATSLRVGQSFDNTPAMIKQLDVAQQAALLVEYQATEAQALESLTAAARRTLAGLPVAQPVTLTADPRVRDELWTLRNGLYTSVAGARQPGTTALLEDVVVPVPSLATTCAELTKLFDRFAYADSVIFGHAKDGNIHFMITDRFQDEALTRYRDFTDAMVSLILSHSGSLKAEHGTGRVMAPFVERQYGAELYDVMVGVKKLFDPAGRLNDSVVISDDKELHMKHIKAPVVVGDETDRCSECGYCEPVCPSRNLTLTPRQRIVLRREIALARQHGDDTTARAISERYRYAGLQTCAADGMCSTACPMQINTGTMIKRLRQHDVPPLARSIWTTAARHWAGATTLAAAALSVTHALRPVAPLIRGVNNLGRALLGTDNIPLWSPELPKGGNARARTPIGQPAAVYVPACVSRMFESGVQDAFLTLCAMAGIDVLVPRDIESLCCGTVWSSKGITSGYDAMRARALSSLQRASDGGRLPIIVDASSCTEGFMKMADASPSGHLTIVDATSFVADNVLDKLPPHQKLASLTIHQTCSSTQIGLNPALLRVAHAVAEQINVPTATGCCAFAGDRGLLHPELTFAATRPEAAEVAVLDASAHASCNRTCELGMTRATGKPYRHVLELLAEQCVDL